MRQPEQVTSHPKKPCILIQYQQHVNVHFKIMRTKRLFVSVMNVQQTMIVQRVLSVLKKIGRIYKLIRRVIRIAQPKISYRQMKTQVNCSISNIKLTSKSNIWKDRDDPAV